MGKIKKKLGEMLIEAGLLDEFQLSKALGQQKQWGGRLASILISMGFIDEKSIASVLEKKLGSQCMSLKGSKIPPEVLKLVNHDMAVKYCVLPLEFDKKTLTVAVSDPTDLKTIDELSFMLGLKIKPVLAIESSINSAIEQHYTGKTSRGKTHIADTRNLPEDIQLTRNEAPHIDKSCPPEILIEAIMEILIEKGLIKQEELSKKITRKLKRSQLWKAT